MLVESKKLEEQIHLLQSQLRTFPEGKLICCRNGNYYKWYRGDGKNHIYIPKKNRQLAEQLSAKKYLSLRMKELLHEKTAIDFYLRHHASGPKLSERMLTDMPEYQELLSPFFIPASQEHIRWMKSPYERNTKYSEQLAHKTSSGNWVRSKSEALIDMVLYTNKIPFRYECALQLGEHTFYPDFTIRHPSADRLYYWEHFGRMDDSFYAKNAYSKLQIYTTYGIIPSIHLITTYETKEHPLNSDTIEKIVKEYFC